MVKGGARPLDMRLLTKPLIMDKSMDPSDVFYWFYRNIYGNYLADDDGNYIVDGEQFLRVTTLPGWPDIRIEKSDRQERKNETYQAIQYILVEDNRIIGSMSFSTHEEKPNTVRVTKSKLSIDYRGQGLGRLMYKVAINDLLKTYQCVRSDRIRSADAEGVWGSFCRSNPKTVRYDPDAAEPHGRYFADAPLRRRPPVKVRSHRRARHG
jgi:hypothetical protein